MKFLLLFALTAAPSLTALAESAPPILKAELVAEVAAEKPKSPLANLLTGGAALFVFLGSMRQIVDESLRKLVNLPAAGESAVTPSIALGTGPHTDKVEGRIKLPAIPGLEDGKDLTIIIEHSDDDGVDDAFATVDAIAAQVLTGADAEGAAALEVAFRFPSGTKTYVRAKATLEAAGGDITDIELEFTLLL